MPSFLTAVKTNLNLDNTKLLLESDEKQEVLLAQILLEEVLERVDGLPRHARVQGVRMVELAAEDHRVDGVDLDRGGLSRLGLIDRLSVHFKPYHPADVNIRLQVESQVA